MTLLDRLGSASQSAWLPLILLLALSPDSRPKAMTMPGGRAHYAGYARMMQDIDCKLLPR